MESEAVESEGRMNESQNTGTTRENDNKEIKSIENLLEACRDLQNKHPDDQLYFRGECCDSWGDAGYGRSGAPGRYVAFSSRGDGRGGASIGRLFEGKWGDRCIVKEHDEAWDRLYHFIRQEKPYFLENINFRDLLRVFVVEPQQSFERIRMQSGAFLISVFHERFERDEILSRNADIPVYNYYTLKVPYTSKRDIREELRVLNITRESLFPGLDEAAKAVRQRYSEE